MYSKCIRGIYVTEEGRLTQFAQLREACHSNRYHGWGRLFGGLFLLQWREECLLHLANRNVYKSYEILGGIRSVDTSSWTFPQTHSFCLKVTVTEKTHEEIILRGNIGTSVHNDKLGNPHKIRVFGIKQTNITPHCLSVLIFIFLNYITSTYEISCWWASNTKKSNKWNGKTNSLGIIL